MWIEKYYVWVHGITLLDYHFHLYTIPALIMLGAAILTGLVHWRNQNKRQKEMDEQLKSLDNLKAKASGEIPEVEAGQA